jgi:membrane protease YdiL (CAAX protease family)
MTNSVKQFFKDLVAPFSDRQAAVVLIAATVLLLSFRYFPYLGIKLFSRELRSIDLSLYIFLLFFLVPLGLVFILRKNPGSFGLKLGQWRVWIVDVAILYGLLLPLLIFASRRPEFRAFYPILKLAKLSAGYFLLNTLIQTLEMASWEFFFRGFMLFGLEARLGLPVAVLVQTLPYALFHFGKPPLEAYGSIFAGVILGVIAYRGKSVLPCILLHFLAAVTLDLLLVLT